MSEPSPIHEFSVTPHIVPAGTSLRASDARQSRVMPINESILWTPALGGAHQPAPLVFITQYTFRRLHDRLATAPNGLGIGLLAGRRYSDARTGATFVIIDGALPLPPLASEDDAGAALADGLHDAATGIEMCGWYRSHSFGDAALTPADVDAHTDLFGEGPSIALVVADAGQSGGLFRQSASPAWPIESLPFYEVLGESVAHQEGPKPTVLMWRNYRAAEPIARVAAPLSEAARPAPTLEQAGYPVLLLDDHAEEAASLPAPAGPRKTVSLRRYARPAAYAASALGGAVVVTTLFSLLGSRPAGGGVDANRPGPPDAAAVATATATLDRRADTLALAISAFDARARMYDARQMTCPGLQRGLQQVEDGWLAYNMARKETLTPFDSGREVRDRSLYADVRSVERRFERSSCTRP